MSVRFSLHFHLAFAGYERLHTCEEICLAATKQIKDDANRVCRRPEKRCASSLRFPRALQSALPAVYWLQGKMWKLLYGCYMNELWKVSKGKGNAGVGELGLEKQWWRVFSWHNWRSLQGRHRFESACRMSR